MKIFKNVFTVILILCFGIQQIQSQNESSKKDSLEVHKVIMDLFNSIKEGDSSKVKEYFHKNVIMLTSFKNNHNTNELNEESISEYLKEIASPKKKWNENIFSTSIEIEECFARVWVKYTFYIESQISYCGVKSFQLVKETNENWKIINLIDKRKKENCIINE